MLFPLSSLSGRLYPGVIPCFPSSQGGYTRVLFPVSLLLGGYTRVLFPVIPFLGGYTRVLFPVILFPGGYTRMLFPVILPNTEERG